MFKKEDAKLNGANVVITLYGFGRMFPEAHGETKDMSVQWALEELDWLTAFMRSITRAESSIVRNLPASVHFTKRR